MHGYLSCGNSFYYQTEYFKSLFNVYAPDLTGFGDNKYMPYPYSLDDYVESVYKYIKDNRLVKPHVIAHSFGARVVIKAVSKYPELFDKIVITGGAGLKPRFSLKRWIRRNTFKFLKIFLPKSKLHRFYSKDYVSLSPVMKQSFIKIVNEHLDGYLKSIKNQVLLIYGKKDKETPIYMAKKLHENIQDSKLTVYNNAGHFAFIDCPRKFNMEVREFLLSQERCFQQN